ncbi:MAG: DUF5046 domain-containing protein [Lachnospiraceae bacterium]|jgi:hypothetical protein|nr:DUF5046 domain-containing protein [Lachnospiraceae bacterium]
MQKVTLCKRLFSILLIVFLIFSLASCSLFGADKTGGSNDSSVQLYYVGDKGGVGNSYGRILDRDGKIILEGDSLNILYSDDYSKAVGITAQRLSDFSVTEDGEADPFSALYETAFYNTKGKLILDFFTGYIYYGNDDFLIISHSAETDDSSEITENAYFELFSINDGNSEGTYKFINTTSDGGFIACGDTGLVILDAKCKEIARCETDASYDYIQPWIDCYQAFCWDEVSCDVYDPKLNLIFSEKGKTIASADSDFPTPVLSYWTSENTEGFLKLQKSGNTYSITELNTPIIQNEWISYLDDRLCITSNNDTYEYTLRTLEGEVIYGPCSVLQYGPLDMDGYPICFLSVISGTDTLVLLNEKGIPIRNATAESTITDAAFWNGYIVSSCNYSDVYQSEDYGEVIRDYSKCQLWDMELNEVAKLSEGYSAMTALVNFNTTLPPFVWYSQEGTLGAYFNKDSKLFAEIYSTPIDLSLTYSESYNNDWRVFDDKGNTIAFFTDIKEMTALGPERYIVAKGFYRGMLDNDGNWIYKESIFSDLQD